MTTEANRELDAWLAEHLFGLVRCTNAGHDGYDSPRDQCWADPDSPDKGGQLRDYSGSWEGAGLVIEAMRERHGLSVTSIAGLEGAARSLIITVDAESGRWYCEFPEPWEHAEADTLPMAVALAARAAIQAESPPPAGTA